MRFVPVKLCKPYATTCNLYHSSSLHLTPALRTVPPRDSPKFADAPADSDDLGIGYWSEEFEGHLASSRRLARLTK